VRDAGDPGEAAPSGEEVAYLLNAINRTFPRAHYRREEIHYAFAGVRPLPYAPGCEPAAITRKAILHDHKDDGAAGMISVIGGKLTTAASLARTCARKIGIAAADPEPVILGAAAEHALEYRVECWARRVSEVSSLGIRSARAIAEWHGRKALRIATCAASDERLRAPLCPHTGHVVAEAIEAMQFESAVQLGDVLLRRVPVALGACWSAECSFVAAQRIGEAAGWDKREIQHQFYRFEEERARFLRTPSGLSVSPHPVKHAA
jgi:glycerol-3-phosphate dehydrogenase